MDHLELPPEILARIFEFGVNTWGIHYLIPLSSVCKYWNDIIDTPRLWGTITVSKNSTNRSLEPQVAKARACLLSISLPPNTIAKQYGRAVEHLVSLSRNWVSANIGTDLITNCSWDDLGLNLRELTLSRGRLGTDPQAFFSGKSHFQETKLQSFTAIRLPHSWVIGFLEPSIRHFCLRRGHDDESFMHNILHTFHYLSQIPGAVTIDLENLNHSNPGSNIPPITRFENLETLRLSQVLYISTVLCSIAAPSLRTLIIDRTPDLEWWRWRNEFTKHLIPMTPFFSQWSRPGFVPMNLHTFELTQCLQPTDVPHLIRWLARLPNIVHLILKDDAIGKAATTLSSEAEQTNIYEALASPAGGRSGCGEPGGWLCPSLTILHLDTDDVVADLIPIARARGGFDISAHYVHPPKALRRMEALICSSSSQEEKEELCSLVEQAICVCISCGLAIAGTYFY